MKTITSFLFMSLPRHDDEYTSTPWQIASELSKRNNVFLIDNPFTFTEAIVKFRSSQVRKRIRAYFGKATQVIEGVTVIFAPFVIPINFLPKGKIYDLFSRLNHQIVARRLNRIIAKERFQQVFYINSFNFYLPNLADYFLGKPSYIVYHCIDPMVKPYTLKHGPYLQQIAAKKSNVIITTAPSLDREFKGPDYPRCFYVPNAANFSLFANAQNTKLAVHPKLASIEGKVMGYFGNIERRTDERFLLSVLHRLPDWQLVMAGPVDRSYFSLEFLNHRQVKWVGAFTHQEAPSVIKRFDVAIIPFKCDEVSYGINPLKLFEYLAAGKPVVSTNFNPDILLTLQGDVAVAETPEQFATHVLASQHGTQLDVVRRTKRAWENSWEARTKEFESVITKAYYENEKRD
jgi:teichuronic acid biosynthesis glycosyltransferase TuaH